jgi:hypothetical protein
MPFIEDGDEEITTLIEPIASTTRALGRRPAEPSRRSRLWTRSTRRERHEPCPMVAQTRSSSPPLTETRLPSTIRANDLCRLSAHHHGSRAMAPPRTRLRPGDRPLRPSGGRTARPTPPCAPRPTDGSPFYGGSNFPACRHVTLNRSTKLEHLFQEPAAEGDPSSVMRVGVVRSVRTEHAVPGTPHRSLRRGYLVVGTSKGER